MLLHKYLLENYHVKWLLWIAHAGTKTVAAKGKPKKTWATPLAAVCGVSERELRYWLRILIAVFVLVVIFGLWFGLS